MRLNPLAEIVESFRRVLVWDRSPDWPAWLAVSVASALVLWAGHAWFARTRPGFADVL
jgi:lipopolysaccharide transport system permease protein